MWPDWIEELKSRYLGNEASVFLLHGAVDAGRWVVEGQTVDCMTTLVQFLSRSREILGVLDPKRGLSFPGVGDRARFQHLVEARRTLDGDITSLREDKPEECLALLHRALSTAGPAQGYVIIYSERLFPEKKRSLPSLPGKTPAFPEWIQDPTLRGSDNLVVLITEDLGKMHREIRDALGRGIIEVPDDHPSIILTHEVTEDVDLGGLNPVPGLPEDSADDITPLSELLPPPPPRAAAEPEEPTDDPPTSDTVSAGDTDYTPTLDARPERVHTEDAAPEALALRSALEAALRRHPTSPWPGLLPVREALAQVIHDRAPEKCGPLLFGLDGEEVTVEGPGDQWFQSWFNGIVVKAASEQLLNKLMESLNGAPVPPEGKLPLEEPKLRALLKQINKALA